MHCVSHHSQLSNNYEERERMRKVELDSRLSPLSLSLMHGFKPAPIRTHLSMLNGRGELPVGTVNKVAAGLTKIPSSAKP